MRLQVIPHLIPLSRAFIRGARRTEPVDRRAAGSLHKPQVLILQIVRWIQEEGVISDRRSQMVCVASAGGSHSNIRQRQYRRALPSASWVIERNPSIVSLPSPSQEISWPSSLHEKQKARASERRQANPYAKRLIRSPTGDTVLSHSLLLWTLFKARSCP